MATSFRSLSALSLLALALGVGCGQTAPTSGEHTGSTSQALSTGLVISAVYGGSGSAGSSYNADYVELFNRGTTAVSLSGMSLQYTITPTIAWKTTTLPAASIAPGHYYLIKVFTLSPAVGLEALPAVDFDGSATAANYGTGSGIVAIVNRLTALTCDNPASGTAACADADIVDFVGYGSDVMTSGASTAPPKLFEGATAAPSPNPAPGTPTVVTNGLFRKNGGCTETDNNGADFEIKAYSTTVFARNSTSDPHDCSGDAGTTDAATDGATDSATIDSATTDSATTDAADSATADAADSATSDADAATDAAADASDTGTADTGTEPEDTGSEPEDTGTATTDSGTSDDTGVTTEAPVTDEDSCGCRVAGASHESSMAAFGALALATVLVRRRRNR